MIMVVLSLSEYEKISICETVKQKKQKQLFYLKKKKKKANVNRES